MGLLKGKQTLFFWETNFIFLVPTTFHIVPTRVLKVIPNDKVMHWLVPDSDALYSAELPTLGRILRVKFIPVVIFKLT